MSKELNMLQRLVIGDEPLIRLFTHGAYQDNYPPYNLTQESKDRYVLELAVAGFSENEIKVTVKKNALTIASQVGDTLTAEEPAHWNSASGSAFTGFNTLPKAEVYPRVIHQGLANRSFYRQWSIGEGWKVSGANLKNGILKVTLDYEVPEDQKAVPIQITTDERQTLKG